MKMNMAQQALAFASIAHETQVRRYTGEPYITHPTNVAHVVAKVPGISEAAVCAALLHDVVEDTDVTIEDIELYFGMAVAVYVFRLTDPVRPEMNRVARKAEDRERLSNSSNEVKTIKLADIIDNANSIVAHDPKFAKQFMKETKDLLVALEGGDSELFKTANDLVEQYYV
jgi:(p)ppGpp synthase/HD superfamily hydrolase